MVLTRTRYSFMLEEVNVCSASGLFVRGQEHSGRCVKHKRSEGSEVPRKTPDIRFARTEAGVSKVGILDAPD